MKFPKTVYVPRSIEIQPDGWLGAALARRSGTNPDAVQIAEATVRMWYDIAAALQSIIGKQAFASLYNRSAVLAARQHRWLASSPAGANRTLDFAGLQSLIAQQNSANAALGSSALLQSFYCVLASLIGPALCQQLLASVRDHPARAHHETNP